MPRWIASAVHGHLDAAAGPRIGLDVAITHFSVETAGTFDLEAELKIWVSGTPAPIQKTFNRKVNVYDVYRVLTHYVTHA
jgi:hypothetical protein